MTALAEINQQADQALTTAPTPTVKLEDWRYVNFKTISESINPGSAGNNDQVPEFLNHLPSLVIDNGHVTKNALEAHCSLSDTASNTNWYADLQASNTPDALRCINSASQHINIALKGIGQQASVIVLRSSGGQYGLNINIHAPKGSVGDLIIVHDHAENSSAHIAIHVQAEQDAVVRIDEIELQINDARLFLFKYADLFKAAQVSWQHMGFALGINRQYWQAQIHDVEGNCQLGSACLTNGTHQAHHIINMRHLSPKTYSTQLFKSIALDETRYSFNGLTHMADDADESSANQQNANLQLSTKARVHSRPQLDIHTDDVIATHGSATGQADPAELYYLRTRGLNKQEAEELIISGFLQEVTGNFHSPLCKQWAANKISEIL